MRPRHMLRLLHSDGQEFAEGGPAGLGRGASSRLKAVDGGFAYGNWWMYPLKWMFFTVSLDNPWRHRLQRACPVANYRKINGKSIGKRWENHRNDDGFMG